MRNRFSRIRKLLSQAERAMSKQSMRRDVQRFYDTGELPQTEPARSFVVLMQSFDKLTDASVGGSDYEEAQADYEQAVRRWEKAESGIEWVTP